MLEFWNLQDTFFIETLIHNRTAVIGTEHELDFELTKGNPYLALKGELWGAYCKTFAENWPRKLTALYFT